MGDQIPLMCFSDPQALLGDAYKSKNLEQFQQALELRANPDIKDKDINLSIFEKCCQTPNYGDFIRECIQNGSDVNKLNEYYGKRPIHFSVESENVDNIKALLEEPSLQIDHEFEDLTPINYLAKCLTPINFPTVFECIKLLIVNNANVNISTSRELTPILLILYNEQLTTENKESVIKFILEHCENNIDLDTCRDGEAREMLSEQFPKLELPPMRSPDDNNYWDFIKLITLLRRGDEQSFLIGFDAYQQRTTNNGDDDDNRKNLFREIDGGDTLLTVTAKMGLVKACKKLLRSGDDVNYKPKHSECPLKYACMYGKWEILKILLKCKNIYINDDDQLLSLCITNMGNDPSSCDYLKCFQLLLKRNDVDVNQRDKDGFTPLHWAVKYNNKPVTMELLKMGAYIGTRNIFNDYPITDIDAKVMESHLNSCITTNGLRPGDNNYEIIFDYTNLVPGNVQQTIQGANKLSDVPSKSSSVYHNNNINNNNNNNFISDEMAPIEYMSNNQELKHLIKHPIIASFLFLKWHRLAFIFYTNFIAYAFYCLSLICYIIFCYNASDNRASKELSAILLLLTVIGTICICLREISQIIMSPRKYLQSKENILEIILIILTLFVILNIRVDESVRRTIAAFTILLSITEFFILTGSLPILSFSTHLVMLQTVTKSFLKSLTLYSMIIIGFAICFYTLLNENSTGDDVVSPIAAEASTQQYRSSMLVAPSKVDSVSGGGGSSNPVCCEQEDEFNSFTGPGIAMIKTIVMLTGEFDASDINFKQNVSSYAMFLIFIFLISSVLVNLLNGLAVSDIQVIKNEAELMNFIHRASLMSRYEKILIGRGESHCCNFILKKWTSNVLSLFPNYLPKNKIKVKPNSNNSIQIPYNRGGDDMNSNVQKNESNNEDSMDLKCSIIPFSCFFGKKCSSMESKIVKYAKIVLDGKDRENEEQEEKEALKKQLTHLELTITNLQNSMNIIVNKLNHNEKVK